MEMTRRELFAGLGAATVAASLPLNLLASAADDCHIEHRRQDDTVMLTVCVGWKAAPNGMVYSRALSYTDLDIEEFGRDIVMADAERQIRESITGPNRETFIQHPRNMVYAEEWMATGKTGDAYARRMAFERAKEK